MHTRFIKSGLGPVLLALACSSAMALRSPDIAGRVVIDNLRFGTVDLTPDDGVAASYALVADHGDVLHVYSGLFGTDYPADAVDDAHSAGGAYSSLTSHFSSPRGGGLAFGVSSAQGSVAVTLAGAWSGLDPANGRVHQTAAGVVRLGTSPAGDALVVGPNTQLWMAADISYDVTLIPAEGDVPMLVDVGAALSLYTEDRDFDSPYASLGERLAGLQGQAADGVWVSYRNDSSEPVVMEATISAYLQVQYDPTVTPAVPEASTSTLAAAGVLGLLVTFRRRRRH